MPRKRSRRPKRARPAMRGAGFFDDFVTGFKMPFQAINSIAPGLIGNAASLIHPAAGMAAKLVGLGKRQKRASGGLSYIKT